jgi:uncharacterized BrkB/YihY/UPF0761 family membrane protein
VQPRPLARTTRLTRRVAAACHEDRVDGLAAEFAFFGVLSTFPGLLVVAALLGSLERLVGHDLASRSEALVLRAMDQVLTSSAAGLRDAVRELFARPSRGVAVLVAWAATVYHVAPGRRLRWREALPGAVAAAVLWLVASGGFSLYLRVAADANRVLGTLGGGLIGVLWLYLLALILLVGGELNGVLHRGREPGRQVARPG